MANLKEKKQNNQPTNMWCFIIISFSEYDFWDQPELIEHPSYDTGIDSIYSNLI